MASTKVLISALSSTALISLAPNLILLAFPQYTSGEGAKSSFLSLGQALAAGGLLGDVFLHTLAHDAGQDEQVGLWVLVGFTIFLLVEMIMRSLGEGDHHHHHHHHHNHNDTTTNKANNCTTEKIEKTQETNKENGVDNNATQQSNEEQAPQESEENHSTTSTKFTLSSTVLLNLAADALHNFTDGLAIGASYAIQGSSSSSSSDSSGGILSVLTSRAGLATLSILFHEIPHELGDFCTLVKAGCSKKQAILAQFSTAIAAMIGTVLGVFAIEGFGGERLLHITAGGFVYLAAVSILPEVLNDGESLKSSRNEKLMFRVTQICAFGAGIGCMYAVAMLEEYEDDHHQHHHHHHHDHNHAHQMHHDHDHHSHNHHDEL